MLRVGYYGFMGRKIGRNAPCPCRSGSKFKDCCGKGAPPPFPLSGPEKLRADPEFARVLQAIERAGEPRGQLVPSIEFKGYRVRAVRSRIYLRPLSETFHEFLINLLKRTLGEAWHKAQVKLPLEKRHQIHKWYKAFADLSRSVVGDPRHRDGGSWWAEPTGDTQALMALAYDLCHLLHRGGLPREILERLKSYGEFQSARYEIAVAATFVRAGCRIKFISEKARKHCEFIAEDPATGATIAVEAKSRHRPGVLHYPGEVEELKALRGDVEGLVNEALKKDPGDSAFMIFIDLNVPPVGRIPIQERPWFQDVWGSMQSLEAPTPENPAECNGIFLTNFSYHWQASKRASGGEHLWILPKYARHSVPEELVGRIVAAVQTYGSIPREV